MSEFQPRVALQQLAVQVPAGARAHGPIRNLRLVGFQVGQEIRQVPCRHRRIDDQDVRQRQGQRQGRNILGRVDFHVLVD
ncbi:hypothetical protein G6F65_022984 [Rhizopus arrhizus]|nr:hypothetical protein G6F65_022984 [Rhizopus arrhizus]